jgi:hypothetical protein
MLISPVGLRRDHVLDAADFRSEKEHIGNLNNVLLRAERANDKVAGTETEESVTEDIIAQLFQNHILGVVTLR